jgi:hypothetical protein
MVNVAEQLLLMIVVFVAETDQLVLIVHGQHGMMITIVIHQIILQNVVMMVVTVALATALKVV